MSAKTARPSSAARSPPGLRKLVLPYRQTAAFCFFNVRKFWSNGPAGHGENIYFGGADRYAFFLGGYHEFIIRCLDRPASAEFSPVVARGTSNLELDILVVGAREVQEVFMRP